VREAQRAVSKADFINKLCVALKEADETQYWFELIDKKLFPVNEKMQKDLEEIISLLVVIINSSKKNNNN
jgi:four helix bundle protein